MRNKLITLHWKLYKDREKRKVRGSDQLRGKELRAHNLKLQKLARQGEQIANYKKRVNNVVKKSYDLTNRYGALLNIYYKREKDFFAAIKKKGHKDVINSKVGLVKTAVISFETSCQQAEKFCPEDTLYCGWRGLRISKKDYKNTDITPNMLTAFKVHYK